MDMIYEMNFEDIMDDADINQALGRNSPNPSREEVMADNLDPVWLNEEVEAYDDEDEEVEGDPEGLDNLATIEGNLDAIEDDFEFTVAGEKLTKAEMVTRLATVEEARKKSEELTTYFENFKQIDDQMNHAFVASSTENDIKLNNVRNKLRDPGITDTQRGQLYNELQKLEGNKRVLDERVQSFFAARELREQQAELVRLTQTNHAMTAKYGNQWVDNMAPAITNYINESGIASPEMRKAISPAMLEVLMKAMKYDKLEASGKAKVKEVAAAKKQAPVRSTSGTSQVRTKGITRKEMLWRKAMKENDTTAMFNLLED